MAGSRDILVTSGNNIKITRFIKFGLVVWMIDAFPYRKQGAFAIKER